MVYPENYPHEVDSLPLIQSMSNLSLPRRTPACQREGLAAAGMGGARPKPRMRAGRSVLEEIRATQTGLRPQSPLFHVGCLQTPTERRVGGEKRTASEEQTKREQTAHAAREGLILSARNQGGVN